MGPRLTIVAGLAAGATVAALVLVVLLGSGPGPGTAAATPSAPPGSFGPPPSGSVTASGSPGPSDQPTARPTSSLITAAFHIGQPAPTLVVPQLGGGTIDLAAVKGKPVWINFMATWCPPCRDEFPIMNGFAARYADKGLVVIAVDVREDEDTVATFAQELGATFPVGLDAQGAAQDAWGAVVLPVHFWIDKDGVIRDGALGGIGPDLMAAALRKILPGVDVTP